MEIKTNSRKYYFYIENNYLIIKKRSLLGEKGIKKIECSKIENLEYRNPYENVNFVLKIFYYIFSFIITLFLFWAVEYENIWKKDLIITYIVNNDEAIFSLDIKLNNDEIHQLRSAISAHSI